MMQKYDSYKDSGVQWLGEIPSHWEVKRTKYVWQETDCRSEYGSEQLLSVSQYDGVREAQSDSRSESLKGYKVVKQDELVINIMLAWLGGLGVSNYEGIVSPAYCVYKLHDAQNPRFLHYLYRTPMYLGEFARHSTGIVPSRWRMYTDDFGEVLTLLPPIEEQNAMVAYLDEQTAKIDTAIAQQQKMIDLLNERKQIIINRAVTKGLNPNVKMKDSGVEWIGKVPEGWEIKKMKFICTVNDEVLPESSGDFKIKYIEIGDVDFNNGIMGSSEYSFKEAPSRARRITRKGDVIISTVRTYLKAIAKIEEDGYIVSTGFAVLRGHNIMSDFLAYSLMTDSFVMRVLANSVGVSYPAITAADLMNLEIAIPPIKTQGEIIYYLQKNTKDINSAIKTAEKQIVLLQERKQIIINDVVTGKVKVC